MKKEYSDHELKEMGYKSLGWANGWGNPTWGNPTPDMYKNCKQTYKDGLDHVSHNQRGTDETYMCHACRFYYKVDGGD